MAGFDNVSIDSVSNNTRQPKTTLKEDLGKENYKILFEGEDWKDVRQINVKILIAGENATGKTSLALNLVLENIKDDEIIVYVELDNSGAQIIRNQCYEYVEKGNLRPINAIITGVDKDGKTIIEEEKTINNAGSIAKSVQEAIDNGFNVKAIIIDGLSFILEMCEVVMRITKNKAPDEGITYREWKLRNEAFKDFFKPFMILPISVIFLAHEGFIRERAEDGQFSNVKQLFIDECSMRIITEKRSNDNPDVEDYYAIIKKHRANVMEVNKEYKFLSVNKKTKKLNSNIKNLEAVIFPTNVGDKDDKQ